MQQSLAGADRSARVSAYVDDQTLLRKIRTGNDAADFFDESVDGFCVVLDVKAKQPQVTEFVISDSPHFGVKIFLEGLGYCDGPWPGKKLFLELVNLMFLNIDGGAPFLR